MIDSLSPADLRVFEFVAANLDELGYCWHTSKQLAEALGLAEVTVKKAISRLTSKKHRRLWKKQDGRRRRLSLEPNPASDLDRLARRLTKFVDDKSLSGKSECYWTFRRMAEELKVDRGLLSKAEKIAVENGWIDNSGRKIRASANQFQRDLTIRKVTEKGFLEVLGRVPPTQAELSKASTKQQKLDEQLAAAAELIEQVRDAKLQLELAAQQYRSKEAELEELRVDRLLGSGPDPRIEELESKARHKDLALAEQAEKLDQLERQLADAKVRIQYLTALTEKDQAKVEGLESEAVRLEREAREEAEQKLERLGDETDYRGFKLKAIRDVLGVAIAGKHEEIGDFLLDKLSEKLRRRFLYDDNRQVFPDWRGSATADVLQAGMPEDCH